MEEGKEIVTEIVKAVVTGSGDEQKEEVEEAKTEVELVAEEANKIEQKEEKEEIITGTDKTEATEVTQSEEVIKPDSEAENKSTEVQDEHKPEKKLVEEVAVDEPKS